MLPCPPLPIKESLSLRLGREESEELFISHEALRVTKLRSMIQKWLGAVSKAWKQALFLVV